MSVVHDTTRMVLDAAQRMLEDFGPAARETGDPAALWQAFDDAGFTQVLVPESGGGMGLPWSAAGALFEMAGRWAAPCPWVETSLAARLLSDAGLPAHEGRVALSPHALSVTMENKVAHVAGTLPGVPWAGSAQAVLAPGRLNGIDGIVLVLVALATVMPGRNLAGEARDNLVFHGAPAMWVAGPETLSASVVQALGAAARSAQMAGSLDALLALSLEYAGVREQFGKPLRSFQVIQHALAQLGTMASSTHAAAASAFQALDAGEAVCPSTLLPVAAAKVYCGDVASVGAELAHQVFGAIGFTQEHVLHRYTTRLWSWRDEFGSDAFWAGRIGRHMAAAGENGLWGAATQRVLPREGEASA